MVRGIIPSYSQSPIPVLPVIGTEVLVLRDVLPDIQLTLVDEHNSQPEVIEIPSLLEVLNLIAFYDPASFNEW